MISEHKVSLQFHWKRKKKQILVKFMQTSTMLIRQFQSYNLYWSCLPWLTFYYTAIH